MKFVLMQSLLQGACAKEVFFLINFFCDQVTLPKSGLATLGTFNLLGVKLFFNDELIHLVP
jgi:hypothetical protein